MTDKRFEHPSVEEVYKALDNYRAAEALLKESFEELQETVLDLPARIGRNEELQEAIITHFFWNEKVIRQTWLAKAFNSNPYHIKELVARSKIIPCRECHQPIEIVVKDRDGGSSTIICQECQSREVRKDHDYSLAREKREQELRTMPYREYLQTPEWQERRARAMKRARFRCQICNAYGVCLNTHHRTYERRGCEDDRDLIVLCEGCHSIFHENGRVVSE